MKADEIREKLAPYVVNALEDLAAQMPGGLPSKAVTTALVGFLTKRLLAALQDGLLGDKYRVSIVADEVTFTGFDDVPEASDD